MLTEDGGQTGDTEEKRRAPGGLLRRFYERFSHVIHELGKFGIVGIVCFFIDIAVFNLCALVLDLGPLTSQTIAVVVAATAAFLGNRFWTWRHRSSTGLGREYLLYFIFNAVGLAIRLACLGFTHYLLGALWSGFASPLADNISGVIIGNGLASIFRFYAYRKWVFLPVEAPMVDPHTGLPEPSEPVSTGEEDTEPASVPTVSSPAPLAVPEPIAGNQRT